MKKIVTLIFVLASALSAFAEDTTINASVSGVVYGTTYTTATKATATENDSGDFAEGRIQPLLTITNGSLDAVLKLRIDQFFGKDDHDDTVAPNDNDSDAVKSGSRNNNIKVINAYVKSKIDVIPGLTFAGGIMSYDYPLIYSDNMAMFNATFEIPMAKIALYYGKTSEGEEKSSTDDAAVYIADLTFKFGESSVRPAFFAYKQEVNASDPINPDDNMANYDNSAGYIYGLSANLVFGSFGIDASGAYAHGSNKGSAETVKISGYAFDFAPYFKPADGFKIAVFMTQVSGDDESDPTKDKSFLDTAIDPTSGLNVSRLYILEDAATMASNSNVCGAADMKYSDNNGYSAYGIAFDGAVGPFTGIIQGAYARAYKPASGQSKSLGVEFDANIGYLMTKGATLFIEGGYLKTGSYFKQAGTEKTQNAYYVMSGITYSI